MKIFNLPRGAGKSMRLVYASEFLDIPILCSSLASKNHLLDLAKRFGIEMPSPVLPDELKCVPEVLVDEAILTLQALLGKTKIVACSISDNKNSELMRIHENGTTEDIDINKFMP